MTGNRVRHILSLSGGKDSAALAVLLKDRIADLEYVFCDTKKELPETYEYLARLEAFLGKPIVRLNDDRGFDHWLQVYGGYLPSSQIRWCTRQLKIRPFERYVGDDDDVINYIGIRADEDREGYISTKPNLTARYPFKEDGLRRVDVLRLLEEAGLGLPSYYRWRSRSGCYFCFFQRKVEWVGLLENHPHLFEEAKGYEKVDDTTGTRYSWQNGEMLTELADAGRVAEIKRKEVRKPPIIGGTLGVALGVAEPDPDEPQACLICTL